MPSKTVTVSTEKWERVKAACAAKVPIPTDPETNEPEYTEAEWPFVLLKRYFSRLVRSYELEQQGKDDAPDFDEDIMTVS